MGEILGTILGGPELSRQIGYAGMDEVPPVMQGGISEMPQPIPGADQAPEEIVVQGDPFRPKKRSLWGVIGDAILLNQKHKGPYFADRVRGKNYRRAMEDFTQDPISAIRRVSQIPGMEEQAWKMYGQYRDDQRGDQAQQRLLGKDRESIIQKTTGLLGSIKEDGSNYGLVRQIYNETMARNGIETELPEEFDPDYVSAVYSSGMTPNQQEMAKYRQGRLKQQDRSLDIRERNVDSQITSRSIRDGVAVRGVTVRERNADRADRKEGAKAAPAAGGGARKVKTKYGLGEVDPSGKYMRVTGPDGGTYIYKSTGENKWTMFKKAN